MTAERAFTGLDGHFEQISALVGLGDFSHESIGLLLGSHVDGVLVAPAYEVWEHGTFRFVPLTNARSHVPWRVGSPHTLRIQREGASSIWRVSVDGSVYGHVPIDMSEAGLRFPRVFLSVRNVGLPCDNGGRFRFTDVRVLPTGSHVWRPFALDSLAGSSPGYSLAVRDRTSFVAGNAPAGHLRYFWRGLLAVLAVAAVLPFGLLLGARRPGRGDRPLRRASSGRDLGLSLRMTAALFLVELLYLPWFALPVLLAYGMTSSVAAAGMVALLELAVAVFVPVFSEGVAISASRARLLDRDARPELHELLERLCALDDLPVPRLAVTASAIPDAYTTARGTRRATIVLSEGLLAQLEPLELEAVVAHELAHIANRDALVMTLVSLPAVVVGWFLRPLIAWPSRARNPLARVACYATVFLFFGWLLFLVWIPWVLAYLVVFSMSRYRELLADRAAALMTGAPEQLMSALVKIADRLERIPTEDLRRAALLDPFYVVPVSAPHEWATLDPLRLFPTHPPLDERLARLSGQARQLGHAALVSRPPSSAAPPQRRLNPAASVALPAGVGALLLMFTAGGVFSTGGRGVLSTLFVAGGLVLALQALGRAQRGAGGFRQAAIALGCFLVPWLTAVGGAFAFVAVLLLHHI